MVMWRQKPLQYARLSCLQVLTNSEVIDNIIEATPGLSADHLAIALLRDHILLQQVRLNRVAH